MSLSNVLSCVLRRSALSRRRQQTFRQPVASLALAALAALGLAGPAAAKDLVPFRGSVQAVETSVAQFPTLFVDAIGTGTATHLGRFTVTYQVEVNLPTVFGIGSAQFIAANGDSVFTEIIGQGNPTGDPDVSFIVETHTITGGTGRFAGATGSFTLQRLLNLVTGITSGSFEGTISSPGAGKP